MPRSDDLTEGPVGCALVMAGGALILGFAMLHECNPAGLYLVFAAILPFAIFFLVAYWIASAPLRALNAEEAKKVWEKQEQERQEQKRERRARAEAEEDERKERERKRRSIGDLTAWYEEQKRIIEERFPADRQRDVLLLELYTRYDELLKQTLREATP